MKAQPFGSATSKLLPVDFSHLHPAQRRALRDLDRVLEGRTKSSHTEDLFAGPELDELSLFPGGNDLARKLREVVRPGNASALEIWITEARALVMGEEWPAFMRTFFSRPELQRHHQLWMFLQEHWNDLSAETRGIAQAQDWQVPASEEERGVAFLAHNRWMLGLAEAVARSQGSSYCPSGWSRRNFPWALATNEQDWAKSSLGVRLMREAAQASVFNYAALGKMSLGQLGNALRETLQNPLAVQFADDSNGETDLTDPRSSPANRFFWKISATMDDVLRRWTEMRYPRDGAARVNELLFATDYVGPTPVPESVPLPELAFTTAKSEELFRARETKARSACAVLSNGNEELARSVGDHNLAAWGKEAYRTGFYAAGPKTAAGPRRTFVVATQVATQMPRVTLPARKVACRIDPLADD